MEKLETETIEEVVIPYTPRPMWKEELHPALDKYKRAVLVDHRRYGKTEGMIAQLIKSALKNTLLMPRYGYIAPYRNQAKK